MRGPRVEFFELSRTAESRAGEDAVAHWPVEDGLVFAVADGVGALEAGQVASALALQALSRELAEVSAACPLATRLRRAVQAANLELHHKRIAVPELRHLGTTLTVTALVGSALVAAHVGDGRLFLLRRGSFTQLTKDHTWAADVPAAACRAGKARRHALSRCLGPELIVPIDVLSLEIRPGDVLVQCSDGVHAALAEGEIRELAEAHPPEPACRAIVRRACQEEPSRDASVQVARVLEVPRPGARAWWRPARWR